MGLQQHPSRFAAIRETATRLLQEAGISMMSATHAEVQLKKRGLANELEKLFPREFHVTAGVERDYGLQKETSYAILTFTMDAIKRQLKMKGKMASRGKHRSGGKPTAERKRRVGGLSKPDLSNPTRVPARSTVVEEQLSASASAPAARYTGPESTSTSTTPPEPVLAATPVFEYPPDPVAVKDLSLIFRSDCTKLNLYSPMSWGEMIGPGCDKPTLAMVHENRTEDGLDLSRNEYTLINAEGQPVRSDRCFNHVLNNYRALGNGQSDWRVVRSCGLVLQGTQ